MLQFIMIVDNRIAGGAEKCGSGNPIIFDDI